MLLFLIYKELLPVNKKKENSIDKQAKGCEHEFIEWEMQINVQ